MATKNTAELFGDTDSSDESVGAAKPATTPTRTTIGGDSSDEEDVPKAQPAPAGEKDTDGPPSAAAGEKEGDGETPKNSGEDAKPADEKVDEDGKPAEGGDGSKEQEGAVEDKPAASTPSKNAELFGDDDDSSEDDEFGGDDGIVGRAGDGAAKPKVASGDGRSMNQKLGLSDDEMEDDKDAEEEKKEDEEPKYVPPRRMELQDLSHGDSTKKYNGSSKADVTYHMVKLPNLVGIQTVPYDPTTHDMEVEEKTYKGYVHNMIRWRYKTDAQGEYVRDGDGNPVRESNTRLVKWSDGSYTLHVGKEVLEIDNLDSSIPADHADPAMAGFAASNGYVYVSQQASIRPPTKKMMEASGDGEEGEDAYGGEDDEETGPAKPAGTVLECVGPIASRFGLRPSSLASEAHRNLKLAVQKRNVRRARIAEIVTEVDPEKEKQARIRGKDDLAKAGRRSGGRRSGGGGGGRKRGMNASYLEEDEGGYDGVSLSRLKKRTMQRDFDSEDEEEMDYGDDDDDDSDDGEEDWQVKKKRKRGALAAAKAAHDKKMAKDESDSSEDGELVFGDDDDDDDEEVVVGKKKGVGSAKKAVLDDDDED